MEVGDGEFSANILFLIVFLSCGFIIYPLCLFVCGKEVLLDSIFIGQIIASMCLLFLFSAFHYKKEFLVRI